VALAGEDTAEVMRAAARLHPDNGGGQLLCQPDHPATHDNRAGRVEPDPLQTFLPNSRTSGPPTFMKMMFVTLNLLRLGEEKGSARWFSCGLCDPPRDAEASPGNIAGN
jgi:hypothetical protein